MEVQVSSMIFQTESWCTEDSKNRTILFQLLVAHTSFALLACSELYCCCWNPGPQKWNSDLHLDLGNFISAAQHSERLFSTTLIALFYSTLLSKIGQWIRNPYKHPRDAVHVDLWSVWDNASNFWRECAHAIQLSTGRWLVQPTSVSRLTLAPMMLSSAIINLESLFRHSYAAAFPCGLSATMDRWKLRELSFTNICST